MTSPAADSIPDIEGIEARLKRAIKSSEQATLAIGRLLARIVELSTAEDHENAKLNHDRNGLSIASHISTLTGGAQNFTGETRAFLNRQREFIRSANFACRCIHKCADSVAALMRKSHVLAINMQIESARLKVPNTAFSVIGQEMSQFSVEVRKANEGIVDAMKQLSDSLPHLESEAVEMDGKVCAFDDRFKEQLSHVESQTQELRQARSELLRLEAEKNRKILDLSNQTLSQLQFQDPMAQDLMRAVEMLHPLERLVAEKEELESDGTPSELNNEEVPMWASARLSAGELELF